MKQKKVLTGFIMDGKAGGVDKYLLSFLESTHSESVKIDFLTNHIDADLQKKLAQYGSNLYEVATLKKPKLQYKQICDIIKKHSYDVTYFNISTAINRIGPQAAFDCNVPIRAIHSHSTGNDCSSVYKRKVLDYLHNQYKKRLYKTANRFYACSKTAGLWMFPKEIVESDKFEVIHNAIDTSKFSYNIAVREQVREELNLKDNFVIGHVGNFCYPKNYGLLLDIFYQVIKRNPHARLLLVGTGPDWDIVQDKIQTMGLEDKVILLGMRSDVNRIMQGMDVFVLPSRFEGLAIVSIEAQASGLPCVFSTGMSYEAKITEPVIYLSTDDSADKWADAVLSFENYHRVNHTAQVIAAHYDLAHQQESYRRILENGIN